MSFFPSARGHGYDLYATSSDKSQLLYVNLASGKNSIIDGKHTCSLITNLYFL